MADKYKVILRGKQSIVKGEDEEIVHEKLSIVFDIDSLKEVKKLLKKPTVIRKNLTADIALRYKTGLEKIGVLCDISPPIETEPSSVTAQAELNPILEDEDNPIIEDPETLSLVEMEKTLFLDSDALRVLNIKMPFWSMVVFTIKWILASIPALILLGGIGFFIQWLIRMVGDFL
jgi:hypothetical protein